MRMLIVTAALLAIAGCQSSKDAMDQPHLMPLGFGIQPPRDPLPIAVASGNAGGGPNSTWGRNSRDMFSDLRATHVGDSLTVNITVNDKAEFDNESDRSRESGINTGIGLGLGALNFQLPVTSADVTLKGGTSSNGKGSIDRSEKLNLNVAAIVTEVLPNGNLVISGSQEIMVNYEVRVLTVAGIVRPYDISSRNTVSYEKVAEARISYGGRGRISDVQQPGWAQRVYDKTTPF